MKKRNMGLYLYDNKTFYYIEAGENYVSNTVERIKRVLIQRNILQPAIGPDKGSTYNIISYDDALNKDYSVQPIFLSKHIQTEYEKENKQKKGLF